MARIFCKKIQNPIKRSHLSLYFVNEDDASLIVHPVRYTKMKNNQLSIHRVGSGAMGGAHGHRAHEWFHLGILNLPYFRRTSLKIRCSVHGVSNPETVKNKMSPRVSTIQHYF